MEERIENLTDADLLARFVASRGRPAVGPGAGADGAGPGEAAFRELVRRHGPMVFGVCNRVLGNTHSAEDAFQATFLVLARRAADVPRGPVVGWLYGVARHIALKARTATHRRLARERRAAELKLEVVDMAPEPADLRPLLDEELSRLPEKLRVVLLLCDVEGVPRRQAAEQLGCPESTLSGRLRQARARLARRLTRRGVGFAPVGLVLAVPAALAQRAAAAGAADAAAATAGVPVPVAALADEAVRAAWILKVWAVVATLLVLTFGAGMGVWVVARPAEGPAPPFAVRDEFDGRLRLDWRPVRSDPAHVSLTRYPGQLAITTQEGTMYAAFGQVRPKNLYLIANPALPGGDFTATTCLVGFRPTASYHQAGLVLYDDDDNYLKFVLEWAWFRSEGSCLGLVREVDAEAWVRHADVVQDAPVLWLRLTKRGDLYEYASSTDGDRYTAHGRTEWRGEGPKQLGLVAKNGGSPLAPGVDARFEFFEVRVP